MERDTGKQDVVSIRWSSDADAADLADVHRAAWRNAYAGIIPGITLERMISRRGARWWRRMHDRGFRARALDCGKTLAGYATLGRSRLPGAVGTGEIYELYLLPEYQGCGLGRLLFSDSRRELAAHRLDRLTIWALADNEIACRFYLAMGGAEAARSEDRFCGLPLEKICFAWN